MWAIDGPKSKEGLEEDQAVTLPPHSTPSSSPPNNPKAQILQKMHKATINSPTPIINISINTKKNSPKYIMASNIKINDKIRIMANSV